ncbi:Prolyl-tRNA synthetase class IIa bacterial-type [Penicillium cf. griseofulvum]|uniref:proline--tRNA ligase n=1 Tax=Penicillium cf. griseofulvum TaxID=2972120 RepID=A0A9W9IUS7_9EURO|nr:Prolyl-tRNA synthetase class IIa bacterial-type [Penicillium cf. griseofulvum]KAJ5429659.1 Prolyl-tRNA synthetase class IIa bacterial-type [Penicillium cf. griseofulvum]KAJ5436575.1 Prolyl-tRNA synthetase class IIa bacterial-type [Penicillium cf. griseofulvum]
MISRLRPLSGRIAGRRLALSLRVQQCNLHVDGRSRVSNIWIPTGGISKKPVDGEKEDANDLLVRGGFLRQAYSGVFHLLPLGLRVQDKLERLIDKHMRSLGASKVSLSSISSQELWAQSGRLSNGSELFRFKDRKDTPFLLAPTHEEEITTLVGNLTTSYKSLPLRVYQISRKYRDEARPRQGLLRGREFIMKDLYTFDYSVSEAMKTYDAVKKAYTDLFNELKIPYLVAAADSGNMGGSLSHEYHFISPKGEDEVVSCSHCDHVYNEELADGKTHGTEESEQITAPGFQTDDALVEGGSTISTGMWMAISHDNNTLVRSWHPKFSMQNGATEPVERHVNSHAVKAVATAAGIDLDLSVENPLERWTAHVKVNKSSTKPRVVDLYDSQVRVYQRPPLSDLLQEVGCTASDIDYSKLDRFPGTSNKLSLVRVHDGDQCSQCTHGSLTSHSAVELGHTFHLGTRYSKVLNASVSVNSALLEGSSEVGAKFSGKEQIVPMQMGCHGIGVSRMISAVANRLADSKGLNWPRAMAPYEVVVVSGKGLETVADQVYDSLTGDAAVPLDVILDDRDKGMGWKLGDADLIGYPIIVVVGNGWKKKETLEVQCRRLDVKEDVPLDGLRTFVESLLAKL